MLKLNFAIPEATAKKLKNVVSERKRSAFVAAAIHDKLMQLEQEQLRQALTEGYLARREEDAGINGAWEGTTLEEWR